MDTRWARALTAVVLVVFAAASLVNAAWMLAAPEHWYATIPGVIEFGPFNAHFVRDVGCIYLATGVALIWAALVPRYTFPLLAVATLFHSLHALVHVYDTAQGHVPAHRWWADLPTIYLPSLALLALTAAAYRRSGRRGDS